jgi:hypothetical protein
MIIYIIMAESIEYSSIVKFINDDIIREKLAHLVKQSGGMGVASTVASSAYTLSTYIFSALIFIFKMIGNNIKLVGGLTITSVVIYILSLFGFTVQNSMVIIGGVTAFTLSTLTTLFTDLLTKSNEYIALLDTKAATEAISASYNTISSILVKIWTTFQPHLTGTNITNITYVTFFATIAGGLVFWYYNYNLQKIGIEDETEIKEALDILSQKIANPELNKVKADSMKIYIKIQANESLLEVYNKKRTDASWFNYTRRSKLNELIIKTKKEIEELRRLGDSSIPTDLNNILENIDKIESEIQEIRKEIKETFKILEDLKQELSIYANSTFIGLASTGLNQVLQQIPGYKEYPNSVAVLSFGLGTAIVYWMQSSDDEDNKKENLSYIIGATIIAFILCGPGSDMLEYVKTNIFGNYVRPYLNQIREMSGMSGGMSSFLSDAANFAKDNYKNILSVLGVGIISRYFAMNIDLNSSLSENIKNLLGSKSRGPVSFYFNESNGLIEVNGSVSKTVTLNSNKHFGIEGILMKISGSKITYIINKVPLESISYIEGKPVHTALVMAYLVKDKHYNRFAPLSSAVKSDSAFLYSIEDDGSVRLFRKDSNGAKGEEIASVSMAIRKQMEGDEAGAKKAREQVCKKLFNVSESNKTCASHFYNILGKSAMGMLENMGLVVKAESVSQALLNAEPHIKYEILKNLDWKMKIANGKKEMANVEQWLERLEQDARPTIKSLADKYKTYFVANPNVKNILDKMVMDLNNNSRLLEEKYKEAVETPQPVVRKRSRLSAAQVANLRSQVLTDNVALNTPFPMPGVPGAFLYNYSNPLQMGGADDSYDRHFDNIKQSLAGFNQKLSSDTDRRIKSKIAEINSLNSQLEDIHRKINEYTRILRVEKYPTGISRTVTLSDVENLINQYREGTKEQTKQIVTLSTAFGKIKMLLEKQNATATKPSEKSFMFDL